MNEKFIKNLIVELDNGDIIEKYVTERDIEGLNYGFLDITEFIDLTWYCEDNGLNELEVEVVSYYYDEVDAEELAEANEIFED